MKHWLQIAAVAATAFVGSIVVEISLAVYGRHGVTPCINPSHSPVHFGNIGPNVTFVVIGDSTAAGRGADYADGIAIGVAKHLAVNRNVTLVNLAFSGAVAEDVVRSQLAEAVQLRPDIVLLSVGANDATHFTSAEMLRHELEEIIDRLRRAQPAVRIVVTGCPQMGSVPRFLQPLRWFAGTQTARLNAVFATVVASRPIVWAHIADRTGPIFAKDPTLFAPDNFHPNARGYAVWISVIDQALDRALD
jgi:acyl-CoA thioesterase-1